MNHTIELPASQAVVDRGIELFAAGRVRRRFRRGLYRVIGSQGDAYFVDIRGLIAHPGSPDPLPSCQCPSVRYRGQVCKHIAAATLAAMHKGWL